MLRKPVFAVFWPGRRLSGKGITKILWYLLPVLLFVCLLSAKLTPLALSALGASHNPLQGRHIVIDPGHGGTDPGAIYRGILEKNINLAVSLKVAEILRQKGANVLLTRSSDVDLYRSGVSGTRKELKRGELNQRVKIAENNDADLFLSIHTNRDRHASCYGAQTFYHPLSTNGKQAAEYLQEELRRLQPRNKRLAKSGDYYVLRNTAMTALLLEVGFLSHWEERAVLQKSDYQTKLANSIVQGLENFYAKIPASQHSAPAFSYSEGQSEPQPSVAQQDTPEPTAEQTVAGDESLATGYKLFFARQTTEGDQLAVEFSPAAASTAFAGSSIDSGQKAPATKVALALDALIKGPAQPGLEGIIPQGTRLLGVEIKGSLVRTRFSRELTTNFSGSIEEENNLVRAICKTVTQFPGITDMLIEVEKGGSDTLGGHVLLGDITNLRQLEKKAQIAVVIDDLGQNFLGTKEIMSLPYHLTLAVMPNLQNSREEAQKAVTMGHQVIIHMPMAPEKGKSSWLGPGALTCELSDDEVLTRVRCALDQIPQAVGLSNHTGSRVTADRRIMKIVINELKSRHLYFLDSKTTAKSVIPDLATNVSLPYAERDVFLDNVHQVGAINKQLDILANLAREDGSAIGIGHVGTGGKKMYQALKNRLPQYEAEGIEIVPVSTLMIK